VLTLAVARTKTGVRRASLREALLDGARQHLLAVERDEGPKVYGPVISTSRIPAGMPAGMTALQPEACSL